MNQSVRICWTSVGGKRCLSAVSRVHWLSYLHLVWQLKKKTYRLATFVTIRLKKPTT